MKLIKLILSILVLTVCSLAQTTVVVTGTISVTSSAQITWTAASGATSYNVYRGATGGPYTKIATGIAATVYIDSTTTPKTQFCYVVTSVNSSGESGNSAPETCVNIP